MIRIQKFKTTSCLLLILLMIQGLVSLCLAEEINTSTSSTLKESTPKALTVKPTITLEDKSIKSYLAQRDEQWNKLLEKNHFLKGEKLVYNISWGFINAGVARMETKLLPDKKILHQSHAHAYDALQSIYPVFDTITTLMQGPDLLPNEFYKITNEGGYHSRTRVVYDQLLGQAVMGDSILNGKGKVKKQRDTTVTLDGPSHSITSAFVLIRTLDLRPKETYEFYAVSGKKKYKLKVIAHGYETIEVGDKKYKCLRVEPVLDEDGLFQSKGKLNIWITRDKRKLPVLVRSKIAIGSIELELISHK